MLTTERASGTIDRTDNFRSDPLILTGSATLADYKGSGYDWGHLFPAADAAYDSSVMCDCFYLSNMSPQVNAFNAGIWAKLEAQVRKWALEFATIYVVTGGLLYDGLPTIGVDSVAVLEYYYKVILCSNRNETFGIGFILKNEKSTNPLTSFVVTIDSVEHATGIDFFPLLPDDIENSVESHIDTSKWFTPSAIIPIKRLVQLKNNDCSGKGFDDQSSYDIQGRRIDQLSKTWTIHVIRYNSKSKTATSLVRQNK